MRLEISELIWVSRRIRAAPRRLALHHNQWHCRRCADSSWSGAQGRFARPLHRAKLVCLSRESNRTCWPAVAHYLLAKGCCQMRLLCFAGVSGAVIAMAIAAIAKFPLILWNITPRRTRTVIVVYAVLRWFLHLVDGIKLSNYGHNTSPLVGRIITPEIWRTT